MNPDQAAPAFGPTGFSSSFGSSGESASRLWISKLNVVPSPGSLSISHLATMDLDDPLGDHQAKPGPFDWSDFLAIDPEEDVEHLLLIFL